MVEAPFVAAAQIAVYNLVGEQVEGVEAVEERCRGGWRECRCGSSGFATGHSIGGLRCSAGCRRRRRTIILSRPLRPAMDGAGSWRWELAEISPTRCFASVAGRGVWGALAEASPSIHWGRLPNHCGCISASRSCKRRTRRDCASRRQNAGME